MSHYDKNELEEMNNHELEQFLGIAKKMLERAKARKVKAKIAFDQVQKLYETIESALQDDDSSYLCDQSPYTNADLKTVGKRLGKCELKLSELHHENIYLLGTVERAETERNIRLSVKHNDCRFLIQADLDDIFGED